MCSSVCVCVCHEQSYKSGFINDGSIPFYSLSRTRGWFDHVSSYIDFVIIEQIDVLSNVSTETTIRYFTVDKMTHTHTKKKQTTSKVENHQKIIQSLHSHGRTTKRCTKLSTFYSLNCIIYSQLYHFSSTKVPHQFVNCLILYVHFNILRIQLWRLSVYICASISRSVYCLYGQVTNLQRKQVSTTAQIFRFV